MVYVFLYVSNANAIELLKNGKSAYSIYTSYSANANVKKAASEFKKYFLQITGFNLPISNKFNGQYQIVIGDNTVVKRYFPEFSEDKLNLDGTYLKSKSNLLFITGGREMGSLYAVYSFFENYLDCRYYAHDLIVIPKKENISISNINLIENPDILYRSTNYGEAMASGYIHWNKISNLPNQHKQQRYKWGLWAHTFTTLVSPKKYFNLHPEYFGLSKGQRSIKQLCLSQTALVNIIADTLRIMMNKNPSAKYWSVSAMDGNPENCQCDLCSKYRDNNHNQSDLLVSFINKIAVLFPDKIISTLAYQKTRTPPVSTKPIENVNIHFCAVNDDKLKPLSTNVELISDLDGWLKLTTNIIFRDYLIYYKCDCPFPNFDVIGPNLQTLRSKGIKMVYLEAESGLERELEELRCYLMAKLMWNPSLDSDSVINEFLSAYYHKAAPLIKQYIISLKASARLSSKPLIGSTRILEYSRDRGQGYLTSNRIYSYKEILNKALVISNGDAVVQKRIIRLIRSLDNVTNN